MTGYVLRRVVALVPVWLAISLLAFTLANLAPGDPAALILERATGEPPSAADVAALRAELGLDDPFVVRYARWVAGAVQGDLGTSYRSGQPVLGQLLGHFRVTLEIAVPALVIALVVSLAAGVVSAIRRNSIADHVSRVAALVGASVPGFWLAYVLIIIFSVRLGWLPVVGRGTWQHVVLPAVTLGVAPAAILTRLTRSSMLDVLGDDHIRTARAMGLRERSILFRRGLRHAMLPVVTVTGLRFGHLLAGAVIVETVFAWPGLGKYAVDAIYNRDYPVIQGFVVLAGTVFVIVNLGVDLIHARLDPRVRLRGGVHGR
jgi:peptide/nickel transport system permease protein